MIENQTRSVGAAAARFAVKKAIEDNLLPWEGTTSGGFVAYTHNYAQEGPNDMGHVVVTVKLNDSPDLAAITSAEGISQKFGPTQEAMNPGDLYKKSLKGSPIESKILAQEVGEYIKSQGYSRFRINLNPASPHSAANMVVYVFNVTNANNVWANNKRLDLKTNILEAVNNAGHPDAIFISSQLFVNQDDPRVACLAIGIHVPSVQFKEYTLTEGMDPKALYQQSLQGDTAVRIQLRDLAQALAQQGLKGYLAVEPDKLVSPGPSVCALQFRIYGNDVMPTEQEAEELKKVLYDTTKAQGIKTEGAIWYGATGSGGAYIRHLNMSFYTVSARMKGIPTVKHMAQVGDTKGQQGYQP